MLHTWEYCDDADLLGPIPVDLDEDTVRHHTVVLTTARARYLLAVDCEPDQPRPYLARLYTCPRPDEREAWPVFESARCASAESAATKALAALWAHEGQAREALRGRERHARQAYRRH